MLRRAGEIHGRLQMGSGSGRHQGRSEVTGRSDTTTGVERGRGTPPPHVRPSITGARDVCDARAGKLGGHCGGGGAIFKAGA